MPHFVPHIVILSTRHRKQSMIGTVPSFLYAMLRSILRMVLARDEGVLFNLGELTSRRRRLIATLLRGFAITILGLIFFLVLGTGTQGQQQPTSTGNQSMPRAAGTVEGAPKAEAAAAANTYTPQERSPLRNLKTACEGRKFARFWSMVKDEYQPMISGLLFI